MSTQPNFTQPPPVEHFPELGGNWQDNQVLHPSPAHVAVSQDPGDTQLYQRQQHNTLTRLESADPFICVVVICGCSLVVLCQAAVECNGSYSDNCSDVYGYTVSVGVVSFVVSFIALF